MECTKEKQYFLIETLRRNGMKGTQIHSIIERAWPGDGLSLRRVQEVLKDYEDGERTTFTRTSGSGRPKSMERTEGRIAVENAFHHQRMKAALETMKKDLHSIVENGGLYL